MEQQDRLSLLLLSEKAEAESLWGLGIAHWGISSPRVIILGLGKSVAFASGLEPRSTLGSSSLQVEFIKVLEFEGLLDILHVVVLLLSGIFCADLLVLSLGQTSRDV